jgi:heme exporter protein C
MHLNSKKLHHDLLAHSFAKIGTVMGILGLLTGMIWARATWGTFWNNDPKLIGAAVTLLIYFALFILRASVKDDDKKGIISAVYSVFAFFLMIPAIYIIPRYMASSHPGGVTDDTATIFTLAPALRGVFYPAVLGWILIGVWISNIKYKIYTLNEDI